MNPHVMPLTVAPLLPALCHRCAGAFLYHRPGLLASKTFDEPTLCGHCMREAESVAINSGAVGRQLVTSARQIRAIRWNSAVLRSRAAG